MAIIAIVVSCVLAYGVNLSTYLVIGHTPAPSRTRCALPADHGLTVDGHGLSGARLSLGCVSPPHSLPPLLQVQGLFMLLVILFAGIVLLRWTHEMTLLDDDDNDDDDDDGKSVCL
jgi:hypothetical protein